MNLIAKAFEGVMINQEQIKFLVDMLKIMAICIGVLLIVYFVNKLIWKDTLTFIYFKFALWALMLLGKIVFSGIAIAYVFFYDYQNNCWAFYIKHIFEITEMSLSSYLVGSLAIMEIFSIVESICSKIPAFKKEIHDYYEEKLKELDSLF